MNASLRALWLMQQERETAFLSAGNVLIATVYRVDERRELHKTFVRFDAATGTRIYFLESGTPLSTLLRVPTPASGPASRQPG